jgi:hypothetical protein
MLMMIALSACKDVHRRSITERISRDGIRLARQFVVEDSLLKSVSGMGMILYPAENLVTS